MKKHPKGYWMGENIKKDFYSFKKRYNRTPRIREWPMGILAIRKGKYLEGIRGYKDFLEHLREKTDYLCRDPEFPKEAFEAAYCECKEEVGWRVPLKKEFEYRYPELMMEIRRGGFVKGIKNFNQFLVYFGESPHYGPNYWMEHPERVRQAYYAYKEESKKDTQREFNKKYPGAFDLIVRRQYAPDVHNWNEFKKSLGEKIWKRNPNGSRNLENSTTRYYECKDKIGRVPLYKEFEKMNGGAASWIKINVGWNNFLKLHSEEINKRYYKSPKRKIDYGREHHFKLPIKKIKEKDEDCWDKESIKEGYKILENIKKKKPSERSFFNFYGEDLEKKIRKGKIEGVTSWKDIEKISNKS